MRLAAALWLCAAGWAHQYHASRTEADWNSQTKRVEMVASLHIDDVEAMLRADSGRHVELDKDKEAEGLVCGYVARRLELRGAGGEPFAMKCIGVKVLRHFVEVYVEAYSATGVAPKRMRNGILTERLADQMNQVDWKRDGRLAAAGLVFSAKKEWGDLP